MDSEDDMHDANDEEDYYSGDAMYSDDEDDDDGDYEFLHNVDEVDDDDVLVSRQQKNYTILKEDDIRQRQEDDITRICSVLSVSRDYACMLLRPYNWNVSNVHEAWFANEDKVRKAVGLLDKTDIKLPKRGKLPCGICFESYRLDKISTAACGHPFCNTCWTAYISTSINDGPGCLTLRCPIPSCAAAVGVDMVNKLTSDEDMTKYRRYLLRSYIEDNKKTKWCPAPGCDCAVEFDLGSGSYDVTCHCSYSFCWNCTEEAHRPVDCVTVSKWIMKKSAESENMNWILANSKPCPKCKRPIEKNQGCMHMTCNPPCKYEFCCLYRGKVGLDAAEAQHLMDGLDWPGAVKDIQTSVNWLKANGSQKIFGIYMIKDAGEARLEDVLQPGKNMLAAGYCMYGSSCTLVLSTGSGVNGFTLDPSLGEFILTHPNIKIPKKGKIYSVNEGNAKNWDGRTAKFVEKCKFPKDGSPAKSLRYIGRVLYEVFPMSFFMEQAGGQSFTGKERALDLVPKKIHERSPIFLGSYCYC